MSFYLGTHVHVLYYMLMYFLYFSLNAQYFQVCTIDDLYFNKMNKLLYKNNIKLIQQMDFQCY